MFLLRLAENSRAKDSSRMGLVRRSSASAKPLLLAAALLLALACASSARSLAQTDPSGDEAANPGPLATDLSPALKPRDIEKAMRKVADWQLRTGETRFSLDWTFAALYDGLLAASRSTGDQ